VLRGQRKLKVFAISGTAVDWPHREIELELTARAAADREDLRHDIGLSADHCSGPRRLDHQEFLAHTPERMRVSQKHLQVRPPIHSASDGPAGRRS